MFRGQVDEKEYTKETGKEWTANQEMIKSVLEANWENIFKNKGSD